MLAGRQAGPQRLGGTARKKVTEAENKHNNLCYNGVFLSSWFVAMVGGKPCRSGLYISSELSKISSVFLCLSKRYQELGLGRTRGNGLKLDRFSRYTSRAVCGWERLSSHVVSASTINTFKEGLNRFMARDR